MRTFTPVNLKWLQLAKKIKLKKWELYPPFGRKPTKDLFDSLNGTENFQKGKFVNQISIEMKMDVKKMISLLRDYIKGNSKIRPNQAIPVEALNLELFQQNKEDKVVWFGHSTILLKIDGKVLLIDPMFGKSPSPFPFLGGRRFSEKLPIEIEELPEIDVILISHDHYDHLDYFTIRKLKNKVEQFIVPLGVGGHLERWGIEKNRIKELNWWEELQYKGLTFVCAPTRHFSGRTLTDRNSTLWSSWVIFGEEKKLYFSGDGGYGPHFKKIGQKYGPFDIALIECGQYDERWAPVHMTPEETAQAFLDVKGKLLFPIHWAAFTLSLHDWTDPIERVTKAARERDLEIATPKIGEIVEMGSINYPISTWWKN